MVLITNYKLQSYGELLRIISIGFWERFTFYGLLTILLLYLTNVLSAPFSKAYALWGIFIGLSYITPTFGGLLDDYVLGSKRNIIFGLILLMSGYLFLCFKNLLLLYLGISLIVCGSGLFRSSISTIIGKLAIENMERHNAYNFYFVGMAMGAILGPLVFGALLLYNLWTSMFILGVLCNGLSLFLFLKQKSSMNFNNNVLSMNLRSKKFIKIFYCVLFVTLLFASFFIMSNPKMGINLLGLLSFIILLCPLLLIFRVSTIEYKKIVGITFINILFVFYYAAIFQVNGSMIVAIESELEIYIYKYLLPPTVFASLQSIIAVLIVLMLTRSLVKSNYIIKRMGRGLICASIGFVLLSLVFYIKTNALLYLLFAMLFLGISSAHIMPFHLTIISQHSPKHLTSTFMGISYLSDALGGFFGAQVLIMSKPLLTRHMSMSMYSNLYLNISMLLLLSTFIWYASAKLIKSLFQERLSKSP